MAKKKNKKNKKNKGEKGRKGAAKAHPEFKLRERVHRAEAAKMLTDLAAGVQSGTVTLERAGQKASIGLPQDVGVRLRAKEALRRDKVATKGRIRLTLTWQPAEAKAK